MSAASNEAKYINILLLGETGIGKSTFVNAFASYMLFASLREAETSEPVRYVPTKFVVSDKNGEPVMLTSMEPTSTSSDANTFTTQGVESYEVPVGERIVRLIDTPGITGTVVKDAASSAQLAAFVGRLSHLHLICVLMKPDVTRVTVDILHSLLTTLTQLGRAAVTNVAFVFTRSRRANYLALDTINCLRPMFATIAVEHGVEVPLRFKAGAPRRNCFYFDNECYNYLVARSHDVHMASIASMEESWCVSSASSRALLHYALGELTPVRLQHPDAVHAARRLIFELTRPLVDVVEWIAKCLDTPQEMHDFIAKPARPHHAICMVCHAECALADLQESSACTACGCNATAHFFIYYDSQPVDTTEPLQKDDIITFQQEYEIILLCLARFAHFLAQLSFKRIKDAYEEYLRSFIRIEEEAIDTRIMQLKRYKDLQELYLQAKANLQSRNAIITTEDVFASVKQLKEMPLSGAKITLLHMLCTAVVPDEPPKQMEGNIKPNLIDLENDVEANLNTIGSLEAGMLNLTIPDSDPLFNPLRNDNSLAVNTRPINVRDRLSECKTMIIHFITENEMIKALKAMDEYLALCDKVTTSESLYSNEDNCCLQASAFNHDQQKKATSEMSVWQAGSTKRNSQKSRFKKYRKSCLSAFKKLRRD